MKKDINNEDPGGLKDIEFSAPRFTCRVWQEMESYSLKHLLGNLNFRFAKAEAKFQKKVEDGLWPIEEEDSYSLKRNCFAWLANKRENLYECNDYIKGTSHSLIYVANEECPELEDLFENHLYELNVWASQMDLQVVYIPSLLKTIQDKQKLSYKMPWVNGDIDNKVQAGNDYMLRYLLHEDDRKKLKHGFFLCKGEADPYTDNYICYYFELTPPSEKNLLEQLNTISYELYFKARAYGENKVYYEIVGDGAGSSCNPKNYEGSRYTTEEERVVKDLLDEVRQKIIQLRLRGVGQRILEDLIQPEEKLSRLVITSDYRIFLPDYQNMEINMEPLVKAVYFLFLRHPEGLLFKELPDYRKELTEIYLQLKPNGLTDRVRKSIKDVTDPTLNSINEKCARIRAAFILQFDEYLAKNYYIDGLRGQPKKIALPRDLVIWEE